MGNDFATSVAAPHTSTTSHAVSGELDLATVHDLRLSFSAALAVPTDSSALDLDLAGVTFMDAAGLGAVMWCRRRALAAGRACMVDNASPAALRLMKLTGTHGLLRDVAAAPAPSVAPV